MKLDKNYDPKRFESDMYKLWEEQGVFTPGNGSHKDSFSIVIPPPNANGNLHIGHALTLGLEDIAVRFHRLRGKHALLLPGADHAGFETQVVYEKKLAKEGKSRFDFTREELYRQIWDFVALNRENFETQIRKLGVGVDWSRYTFTLDEKIVKRAYETFKKMWDEGLIYRGTRLVNFCTFHGTAFADIEVEYKQEAGKLWYIRYPLTEGRGHVVVATTRPETMLGDTAVAVHPEDDRYKEFIGKTVTLPLTNREVPIIADDFVDKDYGTGAVKITPAHDINDFEAAERHSIPMMTVIDHEGKMTHDVPEAYRGLPVEEAREAIVRDLSELGVLEKSEDITHNVGHCYKCGTVIEPLLREQWFVDMKPLATQAIKALKADKITFYPESKKDQLITYLERLRDWNISRQIAWGIPIPAFQNVADPDDWIFDDRVTEDEIVVDNKTYRPDPDVFDTWFSSSSWPYATLDFPDGKDFEQFYPLSLMETGGEILYQWVSRMIMLGLYITGEVPFKSVYVHGYVLAEDGSKMSKSLGNVIDPLEVIEKFGSDALRMGVVSGRTAAVNRGYDQTRVEGARNFANKLWNIARFIEDKVGDHDRKHPKAVSIADHWMLSRLQRLSDTVVAYLQDYRFAEAYEQIYETAWHDLADWYIESSKTSPNVALLAHILDSILTMAHPFAPFVTEAIWQQLGWHDGELLAAGSWPETFHFKEDEAAEFEKVVSVVAEIRYITSSIGGAKPNIYYEASDFLETHKALICTLTGIDECRQVEAGRGLNLTSTPDKTWLDIDMGATKSFVARLEAKVADFEMSVKRLESRLGNEGYVKKAPKDVVEQTKQQLASETEQLHKVTEELRRFRGALN